MSLAMDLLLKLPNHEYLQIEHNCHVLDQMPLQVWIDDILGEKPERTWVSLEQMKIAIELNDFWEINWFENDQYVCWRASSLTILLEHVSKS